MTKTVDPYYEWLGIPPKDQPPNHYRLLGLALCEENRNVIDAAANRQMSFVKEYQAGEDSELSQRLLNELSAARLCLLAPDKKAAYDRELRAALKAKEAVPPLAGPAAGSRWRTEDPTPVSTSPVSIVAPIDVDSLAPVRSSGFKRRLPDSKAKIGVLGAIAGVIVAAVVVGIAFALTSVFRSPPEDPGQRVAEGTSQPAAAKPQVVESVPMATFSPLPAATTDAKTAITPRDSKRSQPAPSASVDAKTRPPTPRSTGEMNVPSPFTVGSETQPTLAPTVKVTEPAPSPAKDTVLVAAAEPAQKPPPASVPTETLEEAETRLKAAAELAESPAVHEAVAHEMLTVADRAILDSRIDVARRLVGQALNVARRAEARGVEKQATLLLVELAQPLSDEVKARARQRLGERGIAKPATEPRSSPGIPAGSSEPSSGSRRTMAVAPFGSAQARRFQEQAAAEFGVPVEQTNSIGMKLVLIPPGEYTMGSSEEEVAKVLEDNRRKNAVGWLLERYAAESPQHRVKITRPFYLGACEVTQVQFMRVLGTNPSKVQDDPKRPVAGVTWFQAEEFCRKLSQLPSEKSAGAVYRLPTEAEWEHACRAGTTTRFSFGDAAELLGGHAWWKENSQGQLQPGGRLKPNAWGLFDMAGNQTEWCVDKHAADYYANSPTEDPVNTESGGDRVMRGGAAEFGNPDMFRCAFRHHSQPDGTYPAHGFRVARSQGH